LRWLAAAANVSYLATDIRVFLTKGWLRYRSRCRNVSEAAGGGRPVLTRASLLLLVPRQVPELRIAVERIAVTKKEKIQ
jgi:hypothetical protein